MKKIVILVAILAALSGLWTLRTYDPIEEGAKIILMNVHQDVAVVTSKFDVSTTVNSDGKPKGVTRFTYRLHGGDEQFTAVCPWEDRVVIGCNIELPPPPIIPASVRP